jgi:hypothetical protein
MRWAALAGSPEAPTTAMVSVSAKIRASRSRRDASIAAASAPPRRQRPLSVGADATDGQAYSPADRNSTAWRGVEVGAVRYDGQVVFSLIRRSETPLGTSGRTRLTVPSPRAVSSRAPCNSPWMTPTISMRR